MSLSDQGNSYLAGSVALFGHTLLNLISVSWWSSTNRFWSTPVLQHSIHSFCCMHQIQKMISISLCLYWEVWFRKPGVNFWEDWSTKHNLSYLFCEENLKISNIHIPTLRTTDSSWQVNGISGIKPLKFQRSSFPFNYSYYLSTWLKEFKAG